MGDGMEKDERDNALQAMSNYCSVLLVERDNLQKELDKEKAKRQPWSPETAFKTMEEAWDKLQARISKFYHDKIAEAEEPDFGSAEEARVAWRACERREARIDELAKQVKEQHELIEQLQAQLTALYNPRLRTYQPPDSGYVYPGGPWTSATGGGVSSVNVLHGGTNK